MRSLDTQIPSRAGLQKRVNFHSNNSFANSFQGFERAVDVQLFPKKSDSLQLLTNECKIFGEAEVLHVLFCVDMLTIFSCPFQLVFRCLRDIKMLKRYYTAELDFISLHSKQKYVYSPHNTTHIELYR